MPAYIDRGLAPDVPQLHALVIGVNDYPHLIGGTGAPAPNTYGQGQLSSPGISAQAIADWFGQRHRNPSAPLGSVELGFVPKRLNEFVL